MKTSNKILSLFLCAIMLVGTFATGVSAFPVNTFESANDEGQYDYFYKYDFDSIAVGTALTTLYDKSPASANPLGFSLTGASFGALPGTIVEKYNEDGTRDGNYVRLSYGKTSGWHGARFEMTKNGKSYTIGNTISVEFDVKWEGVSDLSKLNPSHEMAFVSFRRTQNNPHRLLWAKVIAGEETVNGETVTVADKYLKVYTFDGKEVIKLDKADVGFTNFQVIFHDATQTFSVYVDDKLLVEGRSGVVKDKDGNIVANSLHSDSFIVSSFDYDGFALSRTEKPTQSNGTTASDRLSFTLFRADYSTSSQTPFTLGVDNVAIRELEMTPSRTAYYENSFEGSINLLDESSYKTTTGYRYVGASGIKLESETVNGNVNHFLTFAQGSRLNVNDVYQIAQNGNWTVEFDMRATSTGNKIQLFRIYDGTNTPILLSLNTDGTINFGSNTTVVPDIKMAAADSNEWTHVAISMNVDPGDNKGKVDDWGTKNGSASLNYRMSLWVNGKFIGTAKMNRAEILFESSATSGRTIIDTYYKREALTSAPDVSSFTLARTLSNTQEKVVKEYIDEATDTLYRIEYDGNGNFVPGALVDSSKTSTGSVILTKTGTTHGDLWGFFHNSSAGAAGVSGALDNIKIYEGVIPSEYAVGEKATSGIVNEIDFGAMVINSESANASQNANNGGTGVVRFTGWDSSLVTKKNDSEVGNYITLADSNAESEKFYDMFTPNVSGKIFKTSVKLKQFSSTQTAAFFGVRRQAAGASSASTALFKVNSSGNPYISIGDKNYFFYTADGKMINLSEDKWVTISVIVDETSDTPLVSYLVDGEPIYVKGNSFPYPFLAVNLKGVFNKDTTNMGVIDQRVRLFQSKGVVSADFKEFKTELVETPYPMWADEAAVDFSKLESIDDLGPQFYRTAGVTLENGVLNVPAGETFAWIDYNGVIANFTAEPSSTRKGFNFEMVFKHTCSNNNLIMLMVDSSTCQIGYMDTKTNNLLASGNHVTNAHISKLDEETFSSFSGTMYANTDMAYFLNGQLIAKASNTGSMPTATTNLTAVRFLANSQYKEIYIHNGIKRTLAEKTGDIFEIDADTFSSASSDRYPAGSITNVGPFNKHSSTGIVVVKTDDNDGQSYYSWSYPTKNTSHFFSDIYLNDYTEDKTTVFEYDIRFIPSENAAAGDAAIELLVFRRADSNASDTALFESVLSLNSFGTLNSINGVLYDADGNELVLSQTEWQKVAAIYDTDAGQVSYRVGGTIPYYKNSNGEFILADKIQLKTPRYYRMDSYETRARVVSFVKNVTGTLELKNFDIYTINESANVDFIGLQKSNESNDLRIVAGLDMLYYGGVGFDVKAYDANGELLTQGTKSYATNKVFSSITETVDGKVNTVYAKDYGYRYFVTANVIGITNEEAVKLEVTPYTVVDGKKLYSATATLDIDFTGEGKAETAFNSVKLEGDNLKANFTATDYVHYTNDGALEFNGLNAQLAFNADCAGEVSVNLTNAFGEIATSSIFDVYVDGELAKTVELDFGHHTLVLAEGLEKDVHSFKIVKKSGGDFVCVNYVSLCGELTEPTRLERQGAVNVVVLDASGIQELGNVEVYVQTSEASGDYYIKYNFTYDRTNTNDYDYTNGKADSQYNQKLYRIKGADLVKRVGENTYQKVFGVLGTGEISLAIKEKWQGVNAKDFIGGFHGDENLISVEFYLDGKKIDTAKSGVYLGGSNFEMIQNTVINRCDTEETNVMNHNQKYFVNTNGVKHEQQVEFLVDDFQPAGANTFLQMATVYRVNNNGVSSANINKDENLVGAYVNLLNANGKESYSFDLTDDKYNYDTTLSGTTNIDLGSDKTNRYIEYLGNPGGNYEGLYGLVGFVIDDASVYCESGRLAVRLKSGDNKWYASFDTYKGTIVPLGEVWNVSNSYFLDYNPALYGAD